MNQQKLINLYKTYTNAKLLSIIENPVSYEDMAVIAAKTELENRALTEKDLEEAKRELEYRKQARAARKKKQGELKYKIQSIKHFLTETLNPTQINTISGEQIIHFISVLIIGIIFYHILEEYEFLKVLFKGKSDILEYGSKSFLFSYLLLPIAGFFIIMRKKIGWMLTVVFFSNSSAAALSMFLVEIFQTPSGLPALDTLFRSTSPADYVAPCLIYAFLTIIMCRRSVRKIFDIKRKSMNIAILIGIGLVFTEVISIVL
jgi:hypothetical protein